MLSLDVDFGDHVKTTSTVTWSVPVPFTSGASSHGAGGGGSPAGTLDATSGA
jgi:hypothetical protein